MLTSPLRVYLTSGPNMSSSLRPRPRYCKGSQGRQLAARASFSRWSAENPKERLLAAVVTSDVEPRLAPQGFGQVAVRDHESLFVVQRPGKDASVVRVDDPRTAATEHISTLWQRDRKISGIVGGARELRRADDECAGLDGDGTEQRLPPVTRVGGGRDPDLWRLPIERVAREGHPVLPADEPTHPPDGGVHDRQIVAVA